MKKAEIALGILVFLITAVGVIVAGEEYIKTQSTQDVAGKIIVLDPGHGGKDPGKVGEDVLEKDINLSIAFFLKEKLEDAGYQVVLTRSADVTATGEYDSKKSEDMAARIEIIGATNPLCCISIHQNSYHTSGVSGAQVFFPSDSVESQNLAFSIQSSLRKVADPDNDRCIKENDDYYILHQAPCPVVLVECGFLSDVTESKRLKESAYQELLASAIAGGILEYFEEFGKKITKEK